jgi:hypothetical protein
MLNYKRVFRRVYLLFSGAWVLWALYWPLYSRKAAMDEVFAISSAAQSACLAQQEGVDDCLRSALVAVDIRLKYAAPEGVGAYEQFIGRGSGLPIVFTAMTLLCVVPPALVYGLLWFIARIAGWVYRGFKG